MYKGPVRPSGGRKEKKWQERKKKGREGAEMPGDPGRNDFIKVK